MRLNIATSLVDRHNGGRADYAPAAASLASMPVHVASVLAAAALVAPATADPADEAAELAKARERWAAQDARDYSFRVRVLCFCAHRDFVRVRVRDGRPRDTPRRLRELDTVEELFTRIAEQIERGGGADARYGRRSGAPRSFDADPLPRAVDDEYAVTVRGLRITRKG
jgi:Family of unknown function (DUF6174)